MTADAGLDGPAAWDCEAARQPVSAESEVAPPKVEVARGGDPEPRPGAAREDAGKPVASSKYKVQKGDTLARIAVRQCGSSDARVVQLLLAANPKLAKRPNKVMLGEELIIPEPAAIERVRRGEKVEVAHADGRPAPVKAAQERASLRSGKQSKVAVGDPVAASKTDGNRSSARTAQAAPRAAARGAGTGSRETPPARWYTIRASDSLKSIAERFLNDGRRWREIAELNGMQQPNKIVAGKRIRLPDSAQTDNG